MVSWSIHWDLKWCVTHADGGAVVVRDQVAELCQGQGSSQKLFWGILDFGVPLIFGVVLGFNNRRGHNSRVIIHWGLEPGKLPRSNVPMVEAIYGPLYQNFNR